MTLYEVWYHDAFRSTASYGRQTIQTSVEVLTDWLLSHKAEWYDDETPIEDIVDQAIDQKFTHMTVTEIVVDDDGHVTYDAR